MRDPCITYPKGMITALGKTALCRGLNDSRDNYPDIYRKLTPSRVVN